jgi:heme-degrading monooxygenase HmoA
MSREHRPTIARIWRGRVRAERAEEYEAYYMDAMPQLIRAALGVQTLREPRGDEVEFVTISYWEDVAAMSRFAGEDPRRIHHLDRDAEFLVELPTGVQVLQIRSSHGDTGWGWGGSTTSRSFGEAPGSRIQQTDLRSGGPGHVG